MKWKSRGHEAGGGNASSVLGNRRLRQPLTRNLSKAHVTRDSGGPATWAIVYSMQ